MAQREKMYCVKCHRTVYVTNPVQTKLKNGRYALKGICPSCESVVFKIQR